MADSCQCMAKTTTIISLQLIKINRKKKNSIGRHENFSTFSETEKKIKKKIKADREKRKITDKDWADFSTSKMKIKWHLQRAEGK